MASDLLGFEQLLAELSASFINLSVQDFDRVMEVCLARIVEFLGICRCSLGRVLTINGSVEITHSYAVEGVVRAPKFLPAQVVNPWLLTKARANEPVVFSRLDDLPAEASLDKETWRKIGMKSHVMMPFFIAGQLQGALNFACVRFERSWPAELLPRLHLLAQMFGSAMERKRAQEELDLVLGFERLASSILGSLALATPQQADHAISTGLRQIGEFIGADQVALWLRFGKDGHEDATRNWQADAIDLPKSWAEVSALALPWVRARVSEGDTVRLARIADLPQEAGEDAEALRALGVRSLLVMPVNVSDRNAGAFSIACSQNGHEWPDALMPGIRLLAQVFGSVQAREAIERRKLAAEAEAVHWRERMAHLVRLHTAGEMSVALAHELTQPLGAIENYAMAARRRIGEASPDVQRVVELLDKMVAQTQRAGDVVTRMRSMTQRHELEPKSIDVARAVEESAEMLGRDCELRGIDIRFAAVRPLPTVEVDEVHIQQVVLNVLRNAIEAIDGAPPGHERRIAIDVRPSESDEVLVEIADSGPGIAKGDLERVFESFYSTKSSGLGVGLAICRKLIEANGGKLWASHNPGGGALFAFSLPVVNEPK
ncbi:sensor histidine kinase [Variovorax ginsengisoli]|uniref:histidine kinase n=1 Tax=Variovorax ginsengisoli TaxID=363844 RepID=A0ABT8S8Y1_9BURK|nr:ATP-binding protein [Variovorax ginsengisoli]MDN8616080.1 ATP-binding protein [Variovorax ginsengisoli]MDO1535250.1 ATP-binding protein [Variovorax ginsengisoli]